MTFCLDKMAGTPSSHAMEMSQRNYMGEKRIMHGDMMKLSTEWHLVWITLTMVTSDITLYKSCDAAMLEIF